MTSVSAFGARSDLDDLALAAAIAKKDQVATRRLVEFYFDVLYRFLRQLTRNPDDAQDLAQQTLIRVVQHAGRYDGRVALRTWIYAIAVREYARWRRRRAWLPLPLDLSAKEDLAESAGNSALLLDALAKLSTDHRAAFLLHYVEGLSVDEIAVVQQAPSGTVKSRLHYARLHLKGLLEQEEFYVTEPSRS
jgi:RNA polymerase sigma-70 factor, ECF subfamily